MVRSKFTAYGVGWWFVGFGHATWQIPIRLVVGVNEQDSPACITQDHISAHPLTGLLCIAFGEVGVPCFGITFIQWALPAAGLSRSRLAPVP